MTIRFKEPAEYLNVPVDVQEAMSGAVRPASRKLLEKARSIPAPCGCAPKIRCDRHCRVRITSSRDKDGDLTWNARCNGNRGEHNCGTASGDLDRVHHWATGHVSDHRQSSHMRKP